MTGPGLVTDSMYPRDLPIDHISNPIKDWVEDGVVKEVWEEYVEDVVTEPLDEPNNQGTDDCM